MGRHVIVVAGTNGSQLAELLAERGEEVVVVSRRGAGPVNARIELVACDASDPAALGALAEGADALYNCANPPYTAWETEWPPLAASLISAAESSGAVLVTLSNLYGYGPVDHPMVESDPLAATSRKGRVRATMWETALAAHEAGRIRCVEVRASDFFGPGLMDQGYLGERCVPRILVGKAVQGIGDPDAPHSWSYVPDVVAALALVATDERSFGRAWHVPTAPPTSLRQAVDALSAAAGVSAPTVRGLPPIGLAVLGVFSKQMAEMKEISYQFTAPFELDSSSYQAT
ncbi:MAG: NAD-dependent epimerase/dehydratase family protein, partial [Actinomycetes bacterium]